MKYSYSNSFLRQYAKLPPKIRHKTDKRILIWYKDRFNPQLHDHQLTGKYRAYHSINVTGDVRALYLQEKDEVIFDLIGTHSQLYG